MASEKVTLETLDGRLDKSDARLDRVEADIATLKTDVGTLKTDVGTLKTDVGTLKTDVGTLKADVGTLKADVGTLKTHTLENTVAIRRLEEDLSDFRTEVLDSLDDIKLQQKTMTAAVMEAVTQLHLSRTYEKRLVRLEEAVFGKAD